MPKSRSSGRPVASSMSTLSGLMSRWMMPCAWACSSASSTGSTIGTSVCGLSGPCASSRSARVRAFHERHDVEDESFAVADEVDRHRMLVIEPGDGARFLLEAGAHAVGPRHVGPQHLHRQPAIQLDVADLEDVGEAALRESAHHDILGAKRLAQRVDELGIAGERIVRRADARGAPLTAAARTGDLGHRAKFGGGSHRCIVHGGIRSAHSGPRSPAGFRTPLRVSKR